MILISSGAATTASAQDIDLTRRYESGERFRYRLVQTETRGNATSRLEAISEHEVVLDGGSPPFERVRWTALGEPGGVDDAAAKHLAPYRLSLASQQLLESPRPANSVALLGMVTDLQTFYVAISQGLGIGRMKAAGDMWTRPELVIGDFGDGQAILSGRDCTRATLSLKAVEAAHVVVETRFDPPSQSCLDTSIAPAGDKVPDNFEMLRRMDQGVIALHGRESFVIVSRLHRGTGQLLTAEMVNRLELEGRMCSDATLGQCTPVPPVNRTRLITLERIP